MLHLKGRRNGVAALAFSPCGRWIAAGNSGLTVWDLHDPGARPAQVSPHDTWLARPAFRPDGRLFSADNRGHYYLYDPAAGTLAAFPDALAVFADPVAAPDGARLALTTHDRRATVCALAPDGSVVPAWVSTWVGYFRAAAAFSPDGTAVAFARQQSSPTSPSGLAPFLSVHAADTGVTVHDLKAAYARTAQLLFAPDGNRLVARFGKGLAVYDLTNPGRPPKKVANPDSPHFAAAAFHPDGRFVATVTTDRLVRFWDARTWTVGPTFTWDIGKLHAVAFSPDGTTCAVGSHTGRVLVWDIDV